METNYLPTDYQKFIAISKYARWIPELNRRETWDETVNRYIQFFQRRFSSSSTEDGRGIDFPSSSLYTSNIDSGTIWDELRSSILNLDIMPSMRCMMTAGPALERDEVAGYNCSAQAITGRGKEIELWNKDIEEIIGQPITLSLKNPIAFDEGMYILLCGTGLGFSVERQFINHLPTIGKNLSRRIYTRNNINYPGVAKDELSYFDKKENTIRVADSKYGWASALRILITELYNGNSPEWDMSKVRPAGAPLKTFGGRASGPKALDELFRFITDIFNKAYGRKLTSIECHDICCKIGESVVIGGVEA